MIKPNPGVRGYFSMGINSFRILYLVVEPSSTFVEAWLLIVQSQKFFKAFTPTVTSYVVAFWAPKLFTLFGRVNFYKFID